MQAGLGFRNTPSALLMAALLLETQAISVKGRSVLEVGCGLGLPGSVTQSRSHPEVTQFANTHLLLNICWGQHQRLVGALLGVSRRAAQQSPRGQWDALVGASGRAAQYPPRCQRSFVAIGVTASMGASAQHCQEGSSALQPVLFRPSPVEQNAKRAQSLTV
jgi:hypothetical protein